MVGGFFDKFHCSFSFIEVVELSHAGLDSPLTRTGAPVPRLNIFERYGRFLPVILCLNIITPVPFKWIVQVFQKNGRNPLLSRGFCKTKNLDYHLQKISVTNFVC